MILFLVHIGEKKALQTAAISPKNILVTTQNCSVLGTWLIGTR